MNESEVASKTKDQLKVMALTQRIGEITANYEERNADMRADVTKVLEEKDKQIQMLIQDLERKNGEIDTLNRKIDDIQAQQDSDKKSTK